MNLEIESTQDSSESAIGVVIPPPTYEEMVAQINEDSQKLMDPDPVTFDPVAAIEAMNARILS